MMNGKQREQLQETIACCLIAMVVMVIFLLGWSLAIDMTWVSTVVFAAMAVCASVCTGAWYLLILDEKRK